MTPLKEFNLHQPPPTKEHTIVKVTKSRMRGAKRDRFDRRIIHSVLSASSDADLNFLKLSYAALTLKPVSQSQIVRRALTLLARHITSLHGDDAVRSELDALHMARGPTVKPSITSLPSSASTRAPAVVPRRSARASSSQQECRGS